MRFDIVSDTHGQLSNQLLRALRGADWIVHAGDMCSLSDYRTLSRIAPVRMCLGNNDWSYDYGSAVSRVVRFYSAGLRWQVCHYVERLDLATCDIAICGHTHRPFIERDEASHTLIVNPGSPTFPRTKDGPTIARIIADKGTVSEVTIVRLGRKRR